MLRYFLKLVSSYLILISSFSVAEVTILDAESSLDNTVVHLLSASPSADLDSPFPLDFIRGLSCMVIDNSGKSQPFVGLEES